MNFVVGSWFLRFKFSFFPDLDEKIQAFDVAEKLSKVCHCGHRRLPLVQICIFMIFAFKSFSLQYSFQCASNVLEAIYIHLKQSCLAQNG
jgi:hypothetical protein